MTNFTDKELACKCCGLLKLAYGFRDHLEELRASVNHPMKVTSCCRCPKRNKAVGGKNESFHLTSNHWGCCAVDVECFGWPAPKRWRFVKEVMNKGWSVGINWNKGFIHLDRRSDYPEAGWPEPVIFPY